MFLSSLFAAFSTYLHSPEFLILARDKGAGTAFSRRRKLPLPTLVAVMLSGMRKSVQTELDEFFAHLEQQAQFVRHVSEQAFAKARANLADTAFSTLNDWLLQRVDEGGRLPRWHGLRLVAADASRLRFARRASHVARAASADQIAFGLYLPGAEMMLSASLHATHENERQMLFEHLDRLGAQDLLLLDRGFPCRWLVALLNRRGIAFCMRVEKAGNAGFACVRDFLRSGKHDAIVTLAAPTQRDATDYECLAEPQTVRLIRHVASTGKIRVLMTNLLDAAVFSTGEFGDLYHRRWSIEEAFKRLKHRLNLEHVSGLSQQAALQDFHAKILCDNLQALATQAAADFVTTPATRQINRAAAHSVLKPLLPALLLRSEIGTLLHDAVRLIASRTFFRSPGKSKPRPPRPKPHKFMSLKPC